MGTKVVIPPIGNPENSSFVDSLNEALTKIANEFDKVAYRDGTLGMEGHLDMGSKRIYNLPAPLTDAEPIRRLDIPFALRGDPGTPGLQGDLAKVLTRTELAGLGTPAAGTTRYLAEGGREGTFVFNPANMVTFVSADPQQGMYIAPTVSPGGNSGAWVRKFNGPVTDLWFGSTPGATGDDTVAVQAAINYAAAYRLPLLLSDSLTLGALTVPANSRIIGSVNKTVITAVAGSYDMFTMTGSDITISHLRLNCAAKTGGFEFHTACGTNVIERTLVQEVLAFNSKGAFKDSGTTGYHVTTKLDHVQFRGHQGPGLVWTRGFGFLELHWVAMDYVTVPDSDYTGFDVSFAGLPGGAGGIDFHQCDVLGTAGDPVNRLLPYNATTNPYAIKNNQRGFRVVDGGAVWFNNTRADTLGGIGYDVENCFAVEFEGRANLNAGLGARIVNCAFITGRLSVQGRRGQSFAPADVSGIAFAGNNYSVNLVGGLIYDCTGSGILKEVGAGIIEFSSYHSTGNAGFGVYATGNSVFKFQGATVGNTLGNYYLGSSLNSVDVIRNNGTHSGLVSGLVTG